MAEIWIKTDENGKKHLYIQFKPSCSNFYTNQIYTLASENMMGSRGWSSIDKEGYITTHFEYRPENKFSQIIAWVLFNEVVS